jgi:GDP-4-dehydro-6-deoxy-D-mannose reductase
MADIGHSVAVGSAARVFITGASGFVGRHLIAELVRNALSEGDAEPGEIVAGVHDGLDADQLMAQIEADCDVERWDRVRLKVVPFDVREPAEVRTILQELRPHEVYHLAARASSADSERDAVLEVNVGGTKHLLDAVAELEEPSRVLLASTGYVYADTDPQRPAREGDSIADVGRYSAYTDSKIQMEALVQRSTVPVLVTRAFAHTGPGQEPNFAVPGFARQLAMIEVGRMPAELRVGNLDAQRDLMDVRDVVHAYRLLMQLGVPGETYNVASGRPVSMGSVLDLLRGMVAIETRRVIDPARLRPADIACSTGDASKLMALTGWQPRISLERTLRDTLNYWRRAIGKMGTGSDE